MMENKTAASPTKPGWTRYFWESFMLFMAVTLGFFVENMREDYVDHQLEQQYIQSLKEDLVTDSTKLEDVIRLFNEADLRLDTVISMFPKLRTGYNDTVWRNFLEVRKFPDFIYTDRTMLQLKNSGAMRLIQKKAAADGIMDYDAEGKLLQVDVDYIVEMMLFLDKVWMEMVDVEGIENDRKAGILAQGVSREKSYLLTTDKGRLSHLNNVVRRFRYVSRIVKNKEIKLKAKSVALLRLLDAEYGH